MDVGTEQPLHTADFNAYVDWEYDRIAAKVTKPVSLGGFFYRPHSLRSSLPEKFRGCTSEKFVMWLVFGGNTDATLWKRRAFHGDARLTKRALLARGRRL